MRGEERRGEERRGEERRGEEKTVVRDKPFQWTQQAQILLQRKAVVAVDGADDDEIETLPQRLLPARRSCLNK